MNEIRCPRCGRFLFRATGHGTVVEIACKCGRLVTMMQDGHLITVDRLDREPRKERRMIA